MSADLKAQAMIDAQTWVPVAFFTWIEESDKSCGGTRQVLHQLWVTPLGQTEWRAIETRDFDAMTKAYKECEAFDASGADIE